MGLTHSVSSKHQQQRAKPGYRCASVSMQGYRPEMEDAHVIRLYEPTARTAGGKAVGDGKQQEKDGSSSSASPAGGGGDGDSGSAALGPGLFGVFDGHCGKRASAFCAHAASAIVQENVLKTEKLADVLMSPELTPHLPHRSTRYSPQEVAQSPMGPVFSVDPKDLPEPIIVTENSTQNDVHESLKRATVQLDAEFFRAQLGIPDGTTSVWVLASYDDSAFDLADEDAAGSADSDGDGDGDKRASSSGDPPRNMLGKIPGDGHVLNAAMGVDGEGGVCTTLGSDLGGGMNPSDSMVDSDDGAEQGTVAAPVWRNEEVLKSGGSRQILMHVVNSGDSRALLLRPSTGEWIALTKDHKPEDPVEHARIVAAGGHVADNRVDGDLALSRAIGDVRFKQTPLTSDFKQQKVTPWPDVVSRRALPGDVLFVACDGYFEAASNADIMSALQLAIVETEGDLSEALRFVTDFSLDRGSKDNMTALAVEFTGETDFNSVNTPAVEERDGLKLLKEVPRYADLDWFLPGPYKVYAPTRGSGFHRSFFEDAMTCRFTEPEVWSMVNELPSGADSQYDDAEEPKGIRQLIDPRVGFGGNVSRVLLPEVEHELDEEAWLFRYVRESGEDLSD